MTKPLRLLLAGAFLVAGTVAVALSTSAGASPRDSVPQAIRPLAQDPPPDQVVFSRWHCGYSFGCRLNPTHLTMELNPGYYVDTLEGHTSPFIQCTATANLQEANFIVRPDSSDTQDGLLRVNSTTYVHFGCAATRFAATGDATMFVVIRVAIGHS